MANVGEVTSEGSLLIRDWIQSKEAVASQERGLTDARNRLAQAQNDLGKWLMPNDAHIGEAFSVWYGDSLITATKTSPTEYTLNIRQRGRSLRR